MAGQLAAFAGLRALGHLDLQLVGVDQVLARHAEAARRHLLDRAAAAVAVLVRREAPAVLAALAGVALAADAVHRDRQRLVRLRADRAEGHRAGREAVEDRLRRLDLFDRDRLAVGSDLEEAAQGAEPLGLVVHHAAVLLEDVLAARARAVLQPEYRLRVEQVELAVAAPLVLAAPEQFVQTAVTLREGSCVVRERVDADLFDADAADARGGVCEVAVDEVLRQADRLEDLGASVALQRRDAHL